MAFMIHIYGEMAQRHNTNMIKAKDGNLYTLTKFNVNFRNKYCNTVKAEKKRCDEVLKMADKGAAILVIVG